MTKRYGLKFRYPGVTRGRPVTILYANEEARLRSITVWKNQGASIVSTYEQEVEE